MTFDEYYDGERKSLREVLEKRPWLTALNFLVSPGRKLTAEDCELFWSLLKDAQEDAFAAGSEPGGHVAEPELACRTEKSPPEPVLEPGEYTIGQLMELTGKGMSTVRQWIHKHPVQQRNLPHKDPSSPHVAYTLTDEDISDLRGLSVRNRGKKNPGKNPGGVADDDRGRGLDGEGCDGARGPSVGCAGFGDDNLRHEWASVEDASRETGITPALIKWSSRQGRTVEGWNFTVYE